MTTKSTTKGKEMGCYVNPAGEEKEEFLAREGRIVSWEEAARTDFSGSDVLPVCLINNGSFSSAGVAFDEESFDDYSQLDGREKVWYMVDRMKLFKASDLAGYIC